MSCGRAQAPIQKRARFSRARFPEVCGVHSRNSSAPVRRGKTVVPYHTQHVSCSLQRSSLTLVIHSTSHTRRGKSVVACEARLRAASRARPGREMPYMYAVSGEVVLTCRLTGNTTCGQQYVLLLSMPSYRDGREDTHPLARKVCG
jgi:hypothetical protein